MTTQQEVFAQFADLPGIIDLDFVNMAKTGKISEKEKEMIMNSVKSAAPIADAAIKASPKVLRETIAQALREVDQKDMREFNKVIYDIGYQPPAGWMEMAVPLYSNVKNFFMQKGWKNRVVNGRNLACEAAVYTVLAILGVRWYQGRA